MNWSRREFTAAAAVTALPQSQAAEEGNVLTPTQLVGKLRQAEGKALLESGAWYEGQGLGDGIEYRFPAGTLRKAAYLTADMLLDGDTLAAFSLALHEAGTGRVFRFSFGALNQCSLRMRMSMELLNQNRWMADREGAFLKPRCSGDRVDADKVDLITLTIQRKGPETVRWVMTPLRAVSAPVEKIAKPLLPKGPLVDEMGQYALKSWPGKTASVAEMERSIRTQLAGVGKQAFPAAFTRWGGWKERRLTDAPGFFKRHHDGKRWWLVDPDGYAFWSTGLDCVRVDCEARIDGMEPALKWLPESGGAFGEILRGSERTRTPGRYVNYLAGNLIRALGKDAWRDKWARIALAELRRLRFNTVGNWSDWEYASGEKFPYVRPMSFRPQRVGLLYRDFPDVFHPDFEKDAADYAEPLQASAADPAMIGYFLMNEPTWGFSSELPAMGMLYNTETCATREELARYLGSKYGSSEALAAAWKTEASLEKVAKGKWQGMLPAEAMGDLREFSARMVERYFEVLSRAARRADPNHLNLGMRWAGVPPDWAARGMKWFDVYSLNAYMPKLPLDQSAKIDRMLAMPVMVGEWHFGALDAGLPASGIGHLKDQPERAKGYRVYLEDAAANPHCVGAHWFTLYDQSCLGRFDGENYNIGFLDICNRPYAEMSAAAIASHERMYEVASGGAKPYHAALEYLPRLYL
ncbi:MAG: hypothetical protein FJW20_02960 [Acidimicrobiia bacterium]|nr:hypothetical protein [Acidimicrobiia bacterium]